MPGAGQSTIGIILAKNLSLGFIDTDVLIQINQHMPLQQIIDESDHLNLRVIEEFDMIRHSLKVNSRLDPSSYDPSSSLKDHCPIS